MGYFPMRINFHVCSMTQLAFTFIRSTVIPREYVTCPPYLKGKEIDVFAETLNTLRFVNVSSG
jgi:hypothetical protein